MTDRTKPSRLDGAGKVLVLVEIDGQRMRTFPIRCPIVAQGMVARLRAQGIGACIDGVSRYNLELPQLQVVCVPVKAQADN